ncbi:MAG: C40 family peptidase [Deltaproteobacteria bacterium]
MKAVISKFYKYKIGFYTNSLPVVLLFFVFFTGCKVFSSINANNPPAFEAEMREKIVSDAYDMIGKKYRYTGISPERGFDCSGLTHYIFTKNGIELPHGSRSQIHNGVKINVKEAKPGDLVFFKRKGKIDHVGVVVESSDKELIIIHSTNSQGVIKEDVLKSGYWKSKIYQVKDVISK